MEHQNTPNNSLWLRLWQPFFKLSVYKKFLLVLASFLIGYLIIGLHSYVFIEKLKGELAFACGDQNHLSNALELLDTYITHGAILVILVMVFLSLTSFLCIRALVDFLDQMTCSLQTLLNKNDTRRACKQGTQIPVLTQDKIGEVASLVNSLTSHIHDISLFRRTIEADETVEEVYKRLAYVFQETLHLDTFIIWEVLEKDDTIEPVYTWPPELEHETCTMSTSRICRARRTGEVISSAGFPNICPVFPLSEVMTHTCVPMIVSGKVLGVVQFLSLFVDSKERAEQLNRNQHRAGLYLAEALPVLHAKRLAGNLQEMATRDTLTGLANRRFLETNLIPLLAGIKRRKTTMGILMCDMDFFKQVNDEYGHDVGDEVLKTLAVIMQEAVRASDIVIRYGGEEFLILLTDCQMEMATEVAEKIRDAVEEQVFRIDGLSIRKTLSIGVSIYPIDGEGFWECVKHADIALYQAKDSGRNKVLRFESSMWVGDNY
jgi:diguanylate cyclase (GGDEF)-like protein